MGRMPARPRPIPYIHGGEIPPAQAKTRMALFWDGLIFCLLNLGVINIIDDTQFDFTSILQKKTPLKRTGQAFSQRMRHLPVGR